MSDLADVFKILRSRTNLMVCIEVGVVEVGLFSQEDNSRDKRTALTSSVRIRSRMQLCQRYSETGTKTQCETRTW